MSYFAEIDNDGRVLRVLVCDSAQWLQERLGGTWVETAMQDALERYAGIGLYYSEVTDLRFIPEWTQPEGAHDAIGKGEWRWHNGRAWRSLVAANVWEPGVAAWREMLTKWPDWVQPSGSADAYIVGEKVTFNGNRYISAIDANVWSPGAYPQGWARQ